MAFRTQFLLLGGLTSAEVNQFPGIVSIKGKSSWTANQRDQLAARIKRLFDVKMAVLNVRGQYHGLFHANESRNGGN